MNKYKRMFMQKERIPKFINDFELSLLLFDFKMSFNKVHDFVKFKDLNNGVCVSIILDKFYKFSPTERDHLNEKILCKMNKNAIYAFYVRRTCSLLMKKEYDELKEILKSFVETGLVENAVFKEDKNVIEIALPDNTKVKYSNISFPKELLEACASNCHAVTSHFLKNCKNLNGAVIVMENNELFGKYYHSFLLENDIMLDFSHNIVMKYENYIKLINPKVLVCEDNNAVLNGIKELENNKSFIDSEYIDVLKYAISKQFK